MNHLICNVCDKNYAKETIKMFRCQKCKKNKFHICSLCVDDMILSDDYKCRYCNVNLISRHFMVLNFGVKISGTMNNIMPIKSN